MRITIIGGGNVGTLMAGEFAYKGHDVTVFTSKPDKWSREITVLDNADRVLFKGTLAKLVESRLFRESRRPWFPAKAAGFRILIPDIFVRIFPTGLR